MPNFTAPVGQMGHNDIHDVALLQGALLLLKQHKRLNFWDGPVDGDWRRHQQSLTAALKQLEAEAKITNGAGRIEANGPLARKLKQLLPPQYQSLSAIQGTACLTIKDPYGEQHKGPAVKEMALPERCQQDLERLIKEANRNIGLELVVDSAATDSTGRCTITLKPHGVKCLDDRQSPLQSNQPTPKPIRDRLGRLTTSLQQFQLNSSARDLEIKTRQPVHVKEVAQSGGQAPRIATQSLTKPFLKGAVGRAANAKEDVALVQAALSNLKGPDGQAYWRNGITGTGTPALSNAIKAFETSIGQTATGKIEPRSLMEATMVNMLPSNRQKMKVLEGTTLLYFPR